MSLLLGGTPGGLPDAGRLFSYLLAVTDPIAEGLAVEPAALYTTFLSNIEEALEHAKAADTLGLGFSLISYEVKNTEDTHPEFEFTLLGDMPARMDSDEMVS